MSVVAVNVTRHRLPLRRKGVSVVLDKSPFSQHFSTPIVVVVIDIIGDKDH